MQASELKKGQLIKVQEPEQLFSHDCYEYNGMDGDFMELLCANGDDDDGKVVMFPVAYFEKCSVELV